MGSSRSRTRDRTVVLPGRRGYDGYVRVSNATFLNTVVTVDVVNNRDGDNPFTSERKWTTGPRLTGRRVYSVGPSYTYDNSPITGWPSVPNARQYGQLSSVEIQGAVNGAVNRSSPNKTMISLPSFVAELKDFPDMVRLFHQPRLAALITGKVKRALKGFTVGDFLRLPMGRDGSRAAGVRQVVIPRSLRGLKDAITGVPSEGTRLAGESNLWWRFGLAPLLSDLSAMDEFWWAVFRRFKLLRWLAMKGSYRKHVSLGHGETTLPLVKATLESECASLKGHYEENWRWRRWVSIQWTVDPGFTLPNTTVAQIELARQSLLGMDVVGWAEAAWEITPWSFLVDWFYNVGEQISACRNTIPVHVKSACFMQTTTARRVYRITSAVPSWLSIYYPAGSYEGGSTYKYRQPILGWVAQLPALPTLACLTEGQWGILGSLAATKHLRKG